MSDPSEETVLETTEIDDAAEAFEQTLAAQGNESYTLRLYVAGTTPKSLRAIANLKKICEDHLHGRYDLEVIDIYQQPRLVQGDQIIAVPTLVKKRPLPLRKLVGDMSDTDRVLVGLDVRPKSAHEEPP